MTALGTDLTAAALRQLHRLGAGLVRQVAMGVLNQDDAATWEQLLASGLAQEDPTLAREVAGLTIVGERWSQAAEWLAQAGPAVATETLAEQLQDRDLPECAVQLLLAAGADPQAASLCTSRSFEWVALTPLAVAMCRRRDVLPLLCSQPLPRVPYAACEKDPDEHGRTIEHDLLTVAMRLAQISAQGRMLPLLRSIVDVQSEAVRARWSQELTRLLARLPRDRGAHELRLGDQAELTILAAHADLNQVAGADDAAGVRFRTSVECSAATATFEGNVLHCLATSSLPDTSDAVVQVVAQRPTWLEAEARVTGWGRKGGFVRRATPLTIAVACSRPEVVSTLLALGANVHANGDLPLRVITTPDVRALLQAGVAKQAVEVTLAQAARP